jgi:formate C-acetyltransferase
VAAATRTARTSAARETAAAFTMALDAFGHWIRRHAQARHALGHPQAVALERLAEQPPASFPEALQLLWFAHVFLHAENPSVAISFGRLDQLLGPFLEADLERRRIDLGEALDWLIAFFAKCCEGEESQNAVLGGVDEVGQDATNPASYLILRAMACARTFQPSLVVRLHQHTPAAFRRAATALAASGGGNPGFMNDEAVVPSLQCLGIPLGRARDWSIIGCYEAAPTGDCYPNTVIGGMHLPELLNQSVATSEATDFPQFLADYLARVATHYTEDVLPGCQRRWEHWRTSAPSPFGSLLMQGCVARLACLETGATPYNLAGINILGLGTVVDGLLTIRQRVFHDRSLSLRELGEALAEDFPDEALRRSLAAQPGRFGTDSPESNALAEQVSQAIADMVLASEFGPGVRPYPAFFRFLADVHQVAQPSPDGRRRGDLISYGCGPARGVTDSATALLNSCTHVAHERAACGNPVLLNLAPEDCAGEAGRARVEALLLAYFAAGGSHLHVNVTDAADLRLAREKPTEHEDLTVRVSGFSARFVKLDPAVQNALIARTEAGER